ncbi:Nn.00g050520.m01.CDS01 [Neocucurbitaria sp. VM-36]
MGLGLRSMKSRIFKSKPKITNEPLPISNILNVPPPVERQQPQKLLQKQPEKVAYVTAENIRELRELIRYRYALDVEIWSLRNVKTYQRDTVRIKMTRADAALATIKNTLENWDRSEFFETREEYARFREIKRRIVSGDKRNWTAHPPWERQEVNPGTGPHEKDGRPIQYDIRVSMTRS